nr:hypothetical protein B0A51_09641 [Rachicladosporium sp. CCFEE 5018]
MPPFLDPRFNGTLGTAYLTPVGITSDRRKPNQNDNVPQGIRHDSPIDLRGPMLIRSSNVQYDPGSTQNGSAPGAVKSNRAECHVNGPQTGAVRPMATPSRPTPAPATSSAGSHVFVMESNQPRNKAEMRAIRQAVMYHHIKKTARTVVKRRRVEGGSTSAGQEVSPNLLHPTRLFATATESLTASSSDLSGANSHDEAESEAQMLPNRSTALDLPPQGGSDSLILWDPCEPHTTYLRTPLHAVPLPFADLGSKINAFDSWPAFSDPRINVRKLKYACTQLFGSRRLSSGWVPKLMETRHAFLSTVCLSAAYTDIIRRASTRSAPTFVESYERLRVREEIMQMVNISLSDPEKGISDGTTIAVLHLLTSEMLTNDPAVLAVHSEGLTRIMQLRGDLLRETTSGFLPALVTVTMFMIAIMHETPTHELYMSFARAQKTLPPATGKRFPENPLFSSDDGYTWLCRRLNPDGQLYRLLDQIRQISAAFLSNPEGPLEVVKLIRVRIESMEPAGEIYHSSTEDKQYEVIRRTARVYARALAHRIPLSVAAAIQEADLAGIRHALGRTCLDSCWNQLAGVLFWVTMVASAASHQSVGAKSHDPTPEFDPAAEEARRFFVAIMVRCSVILGFEHGSAVLGTLKKMLELQQQLGGPGCARNEYQSRVVEVKQDVH